MSLSDGEQHLELPSGAPLDSVAYNAESETPSTNKSKAETRYFDYAPIRRLAGNQRLHRLLTKMYHIAREIVIMFVLVLTYTALTASPPKISKSPPAVPFFPKSPYIQDWYQGELSAALSKAKKSDITFIMFYAPWDAESQSVRYEFDAVAKFMQKEVTFMAVNCWQPGSECRDQYSKAYNWPILIAYFSQRKGIHYRGVHSAPYMIRFLNTLAKPLIRVYKDADAEALLAVNDALVLGCVNASPGSYDYSVLYNVAVNTLESDPTQEVPFAVLTGGSDNFCVEHNVGRGLSLRLWNETLVYPSDSLWKVDAVSTWIQKHLHQISGWAVPSGSKSILLSLYLQPGPALILFTPKNIILGNEDYYNLLREVALEYYDCDENYHTKFMANLAQVVRLDNYKKHKRDMEECGLQTIEQHNQQSYPFVVTYTMPSSKWANHSESRKPNVCKTKSSDSNHCSEMQDCTNNVYQHKFAGNSNVYKSCESQPDAKASSPPPEDFKWLASNLQKSWQDNKCRTLRFAHETIHYTVFSQTLKDLVELQKPINIVKCAGVACGTNVSLSFAAMDSLENYHFAERLGIDLSTKKHKTAAVIVNYKMETHHILNESVNDESLRRFVTNFMSGNVTRAFNSETDIKAKHTHTYSSKKVCSKGSPLSFCLTELNSETFLPAVMQQGQVVLVFYYSKQCAFCSGISFTFLSVAKILSRIAPIKFVRINGDLNTLPWEFTMERYPTILFFPSRRKEETRVFPQNMPITVPNLVSFVLINLNPSLKLHAMWALCNETKLDEDKLLCIAATRSENLSLIDRTLRVWRNANVQEKTKLLYKLQQLRNINLLLALYPQNNEDLERYFSQLQYLSGDELTRRDNQTVSSWRKRLKDEL